MGQDRDDGAECVEPVVQHLGNAGVQGPDVAQRGDVVVAYRRVDLGDRPPGGVHRADGCDGLGVGRDGLPLVREADAEAEVTLDQLDLVHVRQRASGGLLRAGQIGRLFRAAQDRVLEQMNKAAIADRPLQPQDGEVQLGRQPLRPDLVDPTGDHERQREAQQDQTGERQPPDGTRRKAWPAKSDGKARSDHRGTPRKRAPRMGSEPYHPVKMDQKDRS